MKILFTDVHGFGINYPVKPASSFLPEWYKNAPQYRNDKKEIIESTVATMGTIKKCIPVFDSLTSGYIITTHVDVWVKQKDVGGNKKMPFYFYPDYDPISLHDIDQVKYHPLSDGDMPLPKWNSPWSIKTPKNYSCLFISPLNNPNNFFTIIPGIVDTDMYTPIINFPFVLNDKTFEGLIPAGTPIAQVLPFKRDSWKMEFGNQKEIKEQRQKFNKVRSTIFDSYKKMFWSKKEFK
jgi:hypothetical protein